MELYSHMSFESIVELRPHSNRLERWKLGEVKARETTFTVTTLFGRKNSFFEKKNIGPCAWNSVAEFQTERARREEDLGFKIQRSVFLFRISFFIFHFFEKGSPVVRFMFARSLYTLYTRRKDPSSDGKNT